MTGPPGTIASGEAARSHGLERAGQGRASGQARDATCMKVREVTRRIERDGWVLVVQRGSHRQYKHPTKPGRVTIAGKPGRDLAPGTLSSIMKQAGLKKEKS